MSAQPSIVTAADLSTSILLQTGQFATLADSRYNLVSADFLDGEFAGAYYDFLKLYDVLDYKPEFNDCDKYDHWAAAVARALHSRTVRKFGFEPAGLAFGCWRYKPDWSGGYHSINWFAYGVPVDETHADGIAVGFYEPQKRRCVTLSEAEINSCILCAT